MQMSNFPIDNIELTKLLIKHFKLSDGFYTLAVGFNFAFGNFTPDPKTTPVPTAMFGIAGMSLSQMPNNDQNDPTILDASVVNPKKSRTKK